jgi:2'-5' RNA ligase
MRAFIAIALPEQARRALHALQQRLAEHPADITWVDSNHLHVTLKFLGEIDDAQRPGIEALLERCGSEEPQFEARLGGLGGFPSISAPRVIWVGFDEGHEPLVRIAQRLEAGCERLGLRKEERPFSAHLTLGRVRSPKGLGPFVRALQTLDWTNPAPWAVEKITLYQSVLGGGGPRYTVLGEFPLRTSR